MTPAHPVRIASNTKTYVAAAVLRAWEDGLLELDEPISRHLPEAFVKLLSGDGYKVDAMTIRHLLTHTSGLFDHSSGDTYTNLILANPQRHWTRAEQVSGSVEWGDPLSPPGVLYQYCDTGYVLLGEILERATGRTLAGAVRELLSFQRLGLGSTYWEVLEERPPAVPARAHQFLGDLDVTGFFPTYDLYGGGGLVTTVVDMARFYRALFTGGVFRRPETADVMLSTLRGLRLPEGASEQALPAGAYRMGIWVTEMAGVAVFVHTGFFGTSAVYVPSADVSLAMSSNQNSCGAALDKTVARALALVLDARKQAVDGQR